MNPIIRNLKNTITKFHAPSLKLQDSSGYIAMFSFLVMLTVLSTLVGVFSILVFRNIFSARTGAVDLKNIYAEEGFIEDTLRRSSGSNWATPADGEILTVGDATVRVNISTENSIKSYYFSAQTGGKYFKNEILKLDTSSPGVKIKNWQDSL